MYELDVIKQSALAKKMGGPPIFNDGFLHKVTINPDSITLDIKILSRSNPLLQKDTFVRLLLHGIHSYRFESTDVSHTLMIIHDLDIRREKDRLRMLLESNTGELSEVLFEQIELVEKE